MITITLAMIVKNEEKTIERCLNCVENIMDEIVIVDTGSTDRTKELCLKYTDKIYDFTWAEDFAAARNFSYSHATKEYIMWLDADDILLPEDNRKLLELKENLSEEIDAVMMKYATGLDTNGHIIFSYFRERLTRRKNHYLWQEPVHEYLQIYGKTMNSDITVIHAKPAGAVHQTDRNIRIYEKLISRGKHCHPEEFIIMPESLKIMGDMRMPQSSFINFSTVNRGGWKIISMPVQSWVNAIYC